LRRVTSALPRRVTTPTSSEAATLACLRTAVAPVPSSRATSLHGYADPAPPRTVVRTLRGYEDPTLPGPAVRTLRGYEDPTLPGPAVRTLRDCQEPDLPRTAMRTLRGTVVPGCSSGCWLRVGWGFRSGCGLVVRSRIWLVRCAGSAGLQSGRPARRRPTAAGAWIRNARQSRPCWRRWSGRRWPGCSHGRRERRYPRYHGWGGPGFLRSQRRQRRSPGCRSPRNCRQTDGRPRVDGPSRRVSRPRQSRRVSRPCRSRRVSRPRRSRRVSRPRQSRRVSRPCQCRQRWPRGPATCLGGSIRSSRPAPPARPWHHQTPARASGLRVDPSIRRPVARARSRPPPTPTLRAVVSTATPPECQIHRKRIEGRYQHGSDPQREDVRRRPTLPRGPPRSTIGAEGLNFRVRNGTGCFPFAMATETLWRCQVLRLNAGRPHLRNRTVDAKQQNKVEAKPLGLLVPVSYTRCRASTSGLSTQSSSWGPYQVNPEGVLILRRASRLDAFSGYPFRT
jgi:hypothetical protein